VYACVKKPSLQAARELEEKIKSGALGNEISCRDVYLKGWSMLDAPKAVETAADVLVDCAWVREIVERTTPLGGRPSLRWQTNPMLEGG